MKDFRRLDVWHLSIQLVTSVYEASNGFPDSERFGLTSQIRRAAVSIPSNIAEGSGHVSQRDLARFLGYARASSAEVECQLVIANRLGFLADEQLKPLHEEVRRVQRMLSSLIRKLRTQGAKSSPT